MNEKLKKKYEEIDKLQYNLNLADSIIVDLYRKIAQLSENEE